ncbi:MAG: hypothetical protein ABS889_08215, partial [Desemzia incerta]
MVLLSNGLNLYTVNKQNTTVNYLIEEELELLIVNDGSANNMAERMNLLQAYVLSEDTQYLDTFNDRIEESIEL